MDLKTHAFFVEVAAGATMYRRPLVINDGVVTIAEEHGGAVEVPEAKNGKRMVMHLVAERSTPDGQRYIQVLTGYTDRGVEKSHVLDPETKIYFNRLVSASGIGQALSARWTGQIFTPNSPMGSGMPMRRLAPEDIVGELAFQREFHFESGIEDARSYIYGLKLTDAAFLEPTTYLSKIQETYTRTLSEWEESSLFDDNDDRPLDVCLNRLKSMPMACSPILARIRMMNDHLLNNYITYEQFNQLVDDKDVVVVLQSDTEKNNPAPSHDWNNNDLETLVCARLEAELPTVMINRGVVQWGFSIVFDGVGSSVKFYALDTELTTEHPPTLISELERRVIDILTPYMDELSTLEVTGANIHNSRYVITSNTGKPRTYIAPTYMNSMYSSYLSSDSKHFVKLAKTVEDSLVNLGLDVVTKH